MISASTKTIGIVGHVWDSAGGESLKTLVIENGKISRVLEGRQTITDIPGITMISLDDNVTLFPGLINLHTHTTYNILPIWESKTIWKNRFQWRANADYKQDIGGLLDYIKSNWKNDPDTGGGGGNDADPGNPQPRQRDPRRPELYHSKHRR